MATPKQMRKLIQLFEETPTQQLQDVFPFLTDLRDANTSEIDRDVFRKVCGLKLRHTIHFLTVLVDETKTVEQLVAEGKYYWSDDKITSKNFPRPEYGTKEEREVILFCFYKTMSSEQVIAEMDKQGFRPATINELLALGIAQPELQREFPIIALGSTCVLDGDRHVANLYGSADKRVLHLHWFGIDWDDRCRFVAVRK